jgi:hypothetical protein
MTDNYTVTFVFDYCVITASCNADSPDSAPDLAWDWVEQSLGQSLSRHSAVEVLVTAEEGE